MASIYHVLASQLKRLLRPNRNLSTIGVGQVDISTQGTVRTATSAATLTTQLNASVAGDTVVCTGSFGNVTISRSIASGFIRIVPSAAGAATFGRVDLTNAQGLDFRGINNTDEVYWSATSRSRWRGGTANMVNFVPTGHNFRESCSDIIVEDTTISNADCSFFFYADRDSLASTNITIQRCRSNNVGQDHVFIGRCTFLYIQDNEFFGHTEDAEHQDGVQIVGGKDVFIRRNHIWNTRAFRDAAVDRNDHGIMINYDPAETAPAGPGRVPERITIENNLIHDQTSNGISIAGCRTAIIRNNTVYDNGLNGLTHALSVAPDAGNTIDGLVVVNNIFNRWTQTGATMTTETNNFVADAAGPAGTNRLTGTPGFVDSANQNYYLTAVSQNKGSASAPNATATDLYQTTRLTPSRGAIES